jgi:hypothetical protein
LYFTGNEVFALKTQAYEKASIRLKLWNWRQYKKTKPITDGIVQCGILCSIMEDNCNILNVDPQTETCTLGFLSENLLTVSLKLTV